MRTRTAHAPHFTPITAVLAVIWFVLGEADDNLFGFLLMALSVD